VNFGYAKLWEREGGVAKMEAESSWKSCVSAYKIKLCKDLQYHNQKESQL